REQLKIDKSVEIFIDFKPNNSKEELLKKLNLHKSASNYGEILNLNRTQMAIIKSLLTKEEYLSQNKFVDKIKNLGIKVNSLRNIEESISTVGGIDTEELNPDFSLKKFNNIYTIGEMVNWDAPTGGFLLQGSFSMGNFV
ncbi:MAG: aminoacetone oxidase family FAD-binding enzyme, partial [Bacteroidetes bacterium]|nr:aminoacetone oxidase family FAD-binding enzyme [Bacteroidota bacterium]